MEDTKKLQTNQLLKELDAKNNILTKLLDENILRKFSNTPSRNDIIGASTRQQCSNLENLHKSSPPQCQDFNKYSYALQQCFSKQVRKRGCDENCSK